MTKRALALLLLLAMVLGLTSCGKEEEPEDIPPIDPAVAEIIPEPTFHVDPGLPTPEPEPSTVWVGLASDSFGISLSYPSHWVNNPGKYTICYYDPETAGTYLTRFALTSKTLNHTPKKKVMPDHLKDFLKDISKVFKKKGFEIGELDDTVTFMGQKAWATTYMAFANDKREIEVMGYVVMTNVDRVLYVYHYTAEIKAYNSTEDIMETIRDSIHLTQGSPA